MHLTVILERAGLGESRGERLAVGQLTRTPVALVGPDGVRLLALVGPFHRAPHLHLQIGRLEGAVPDLDRLALDRSVPRARGFARRCALTGPSRQLAGDDPAGGNCARYVSLRVA